VKFWTAFHFPPSENSAPDRGGCAKPNPCRRSPYLCTLRPERKRGRLKDRRSLSTNPQRYPHCVAQLNKHTLLLASRRPRDIITSRSLTFGSAE
jgi:hypothetical protein